MGLQNKNVLLVDNEDSFTYNLIQLLENLNLNIDVVNGKKPLKKNWIASFTASDQNVNFLKKTIALA